MINIRNAPSMKGKIVGTLSSNETLLQFEYKNNWSFVISQYNFGFVYHKLISKKKIRFFNIGVEQKYLLYSIVLLFISINYYFLTSKNKKEYVKPESKKNQRIFSCPICKQKIRVSLPILNDIGRCTTCDSRFTIYTDEQEHIYIETIHENNAVNDDNTISSIEDCFKLFGLPESATKQEIKKAYKMMMNQYHPDKVTRLGSKLKTIADVETKKINTAHAMLKENGNA
jgi:transcription elongation factor Elf1